MCKKRQRSLCVLLTLIMAISFVLGGCSPKPAAPAPTLATPFEEQPSGSDSQQQMQRQQTQKAFARQMEDLFREEISASQINLHFLLKDPSAYGIEKAQMLYDPISLESLEQSREERGNLQAQLDEIPLELLLNDQKLTYRILQSFLKTEQMADGLELYAQPLATTIGIQAQLPVLLAEYQFYRRQDVDDYLELIAGIDEYYQEILEFEKQKADAGLMMSDDSIDHVIESCESYLLVPGDNFMADTFEERLAQLPELTDEERDAYRQQHNALLESDFVPAYQLLIDGLTALKGTGTNEGGMCGYPQGKDYYRYLVYSATGTSYSSVESLLADMEAYIEDCLRETSGLLRDHPELLSEVDSCQYRQTEPGAIMEELKKLTTDDFPALPECNYTLKSVPKSLELSLSPAFYLVSPLDDFQNNVIYINENPRFASDERFTTLAHEGYPGHLYQNVYFHTHCNSNLRRMLSFSGYSEGWATYVEHLSYTLDNGLRPEMGQLLAANSMASLGIHACLDIYINYLGWTKEQTRDYLEKYFTQPDELVDSMYTAMVENPSNYLSYFVGCMEFQNMRKAAETELGSRFNAKQFHTFLLDMGNAPFDVIQPYFTTWLMKQKM